MIYLFLLRAVLFFLLLLSIITRIAHAASVLKRCSVPVADLGGCGRTPLASFRKILGLPISKIVRTADSTIIKFIITNFYLAASSHEIFLRVGGREGMKGLRALQRHPLPHPPCKNPGYATARAVCLSVWWRSSKMQRAAAWLAGRVNFGATVRRSNIIVIVHLSLHYMLDLFRII